MRLTKSDPTGSYSYFTDGAAPASDVLSDGHTSFTPGLSETNALGSRFYLPDAQGNSRGLLDASQTATDGYNWDAFGSSVSRFGSDPTAFAWNEESGYQSDGDSGLKLLGHRYYDSRTGRFISQDPAGDGDNWYAYADNDPMDETDPDGLISQTTNGGSADGWMGWSQMQEQMGGWDPGSYDIYQKFSGTTGEGTYWQTVTVESAALNAAFTSTSGPMMGMGMIAGGNPNKAAGSTWYRATTSTLEHGQHVHQNSKNGARFNRKGEPIDGGERPVKGLKPIPKRLLKDFQKVFDRLNPPKPGETAAAGEETAAEIGEGLEAAGPAGMIIGAGIAVWELYHHPEAGITTLTWRTDRP